MKNTIKTLVVVMALVLALVAFTGCELPGTECTHEGYETIRQSVIPTCTETGLSLGVYCSNCDAVITEQTVTEARGHDKKTMLDTTATCTEAGVETWYCAFCDSNYELAVDAYGHELAEVAEKAPTCTEEGHNAHKACKYCDYTEGKETVAATGHTLADVEAKGATCTEDGYNAHKACECGYTEGKEVVEATGHDYDHVVTDPTCTEAGYTTHTCAFCDYSYTDSEKEATGHALNDVAAKEATCAVAGYTAHKACACGYTEGKETVEATGAHADDNGDYKCDNCSTAMLPADGTALTVAQALAIAKAMGNTYTTQMYYITGTITSVPDATWGNFYLTDENGDEMLIYGLYSADGKTRYDAMTSKPVKGDEITVYTVLGCYNGAPQGKNAWMDEYVAHAHVWVDATCKAPKTCSLCDVTDGDVIDHVYVDGACTGCGKEEGSAAVVNAKLDFSNKANRTTFTTSQQVWEQNGVKLINDKSSSTSNVADYANPARFYKSSKITIEAAGISKIEFTCNSSDYATALKNSITANSNYSVSVSSTKVTVTFVTPVDSFVIANLSGGQVRLNSLVVNP